MAKDLLADVGRGSNASTLYQLMRLLHSNTDNLFNQLNDANVAKMQSSLACGRVAKASGETLIGKVISHSFEKDSSYHKPISKVTSRDDIKYDSGAMFKSEASDRRVCEAWKSRPGRLRHGPEHRDVERRPSAGDSHRRPHGAHRRV